MSLEKTFIPYGLYWSSPFCRWQGALAGEHALELLGRTTQRFLEARDVAPSIFEGLVLGTTVPQKHGFYGAPWVAGMFGATGITGPTVSQACATSVRAMATAAQSIELEEAATLLALCADRTSNGPHLYYPDPSGVGGRGQAEDPVLDNFNRDPFAKNAMIETAEKVAAEAKISRQEQDAIALLRYGQYQESLANDRAFQRRVLFPLELGQGKKALKVEFDEGIHPTTAEGLAKLKPVLEGGTVTFGAQTHPADGNAGMVLASKERAAALSRDPKITVRVLSFGSARVKAGFMPTAVVPAARAALARAGLRSGDLRAIKTHNPFAVNDVYFAREMSIAPEKTNRFGSPLVYGHPQAPTGMRAVIELIEELVLAGGGSGLFSGCAAGDTAMAMVVKVG